MKLTDEEYALWTDKQTASGLNKTDYLMRAISRSEVRIYSIEDSIAPLIHEIRKIGTNLNQLAYFSHIGQIVCVLGGNEMISLTSCYD